MVVIIKPTFHCNFRCDYCYLANSVKVSTEILDVPFVCHIIKQIMDETVSRHHKRLTLIWHGGEPLLWGTENYRRVFEWIEQERKGLHIKQNIQTNLSLITEKYVQLFKQYNVHVGFSLDGPKYINDSQRKFANGTSTFDTIMQKLALCRQHDLSIGCILVGSKKFIGRMSEVYDFLSTNELNFKFNPLFEAGEASINKESLHITPLEYADMVIELFDLYYFDKEHRIKESNLIEIASNLMSGGHPSGCMFGNNCQNHFMAISPSGEVFPCGRFCETDTTYSYGNLHNQPFADILKVIQQSEIYKRAEYISHCAQCTYYPICHGGCLHDGFLQGGDFQTKTFLCSAYKRIFKHIEMRLKDTIWK
ncbi:MAG: radical SAM protein [Paraprevotella sp.]|nr:radical SAM protein [Paraprevotella sp.]